MLTLKIISSFTLAISLVNTFMLSALIDVEVNKDKWDFLRKQAMENK